MDILALLSCLPKVLVTAAFPLSVSSLPAWCKFLKPSNDRLK